MLNILCRLVMIIGCDDECLNEKKEKWQSGMLKDQMGGLVEKWPSEMLKDQARCLEEPMILWVVWMIEIWLYCDVFECMVMKTYSKGQCVVCLLVCFYLVTY